MVDREIRWTPRALGDRTAIFEYWYHKTGSVDYPVKLELLFSATLTLLSAQPRIGSLFDEKRNIRFAVVKDYKIYYTFSDHELTVLTIWDTRRNQEIFKI